MKPFFTPINQHLHHIVDKVNIIPCISLTNCTKFPFTVMTINFTKHHCCFGAVIFRKIKTNNFITSIIINNTYECIADLTKILTTSFCIVNSYSNKSDLILLSTLSKRTITLSSSPSPSPVRLSPVCSIPPQGETN